MTLQSLDLYKIGSQTSDEEVVKSILPNFSDSRKVDFLVLRSVNFTTEEALKVVKIEKSVYEGWRVYDPVFVEWESVNLRQLQQHLGSEVLRAQFMRCVFLQLAIDSNLLQRRAFEPGTLDGEDRADARAAAKRYTAANIASMMRVLEPVSDNGPGSGKSMKIELTVDLEGSDIDSHIGKKVAARKLLAQFSVNKTEIIEADGQVIEVDEE